MPRPQPLGPLGLAPDTVPSVPWSAATSETLSSPHFQERDPKCGPLAWQACQSQPSAVLSALREGYNNPPISGENLIGLSRARRPHNAIFVNFEDTEVPMQPLEAAVQTWKKACTNLIDREVEEELRKVRPLPVQPCRPLSTRTTYLPSCSCPVSLRVGCS